VVAKLLCYPSGTAQAAEFTDGVDDHEIPGCGPVTIT
jgi:hypothetical protein